MMTIFYHKPASRKTCHTLVTWLIAGMVVSSAPALASEDDLTEMSIEALMDIQVTPVSIKS